MKRLRKIIFWCHLPVGVTAGVVILIMCVTGVLLAYEKQITLWADTREYRSPAPTSNSRHLPIESLIESARNGRGATPSSVTLRSDSSAPAEIGFGRETTPLFLESLFGTSPWRRLTKSQKFFSQCN